VKNILITGVNGFLGSTLADALYGCISGTGRQHIDKFKGKFYIKQLVADVDYMDCLANINVVIHCAARVHIMKDGATDPFAEYHEVNTAGTLNLAQQSADSGVKRFIFISSIKVNGESTTSSPVFLESDSFVPDDPYGLSKYQAEIGLMKIAKETDMEVVIIRPPLIYGPGVKANFLNLVKIAYTRLPLPFGLIDNQRSMIYVGNLVDFISQCIDHPYAANQVFLVSDGHDLSLRQLLILLRKAQGRSAGLLPIPEFVFRFAGFIFRKSDLIDRLVGSLQVNTNKAQKMLGWKAPFTVEEGIQATVDELSKKATITNNIKDK
jgi:UDP-glucose 4-epimerase